jgi:Transposase DDE domain
MIETACRELAAAGVDQRPEIVVADAGYWKNEAIEALAAQGIVPIVAPDADRRREPRPGRRGGLYDFMRRVLATDHGGALYAERQAIVVPVFGQLKHNRAAARFQRRGRSAARSEWRLLAATHNILKLWRHTTTTATA